MNRREIRQTTDEMLRRVNELLEVDYASFDDDVIGREILEWAIRDPKCGVMVHQRDGRIVAYGMYYLTKKRIEIARLAVLPQWRRKGHASELIAHAIRDVTSRHKELTSAYADVDERKTPAQLFFKAAGFRAGRILHSHPDYETVYRFTLKLPQKAPSNDHQPAGRRQ